MQTSPETDKSFPQRLSKSPANTPPKKLPAEGRPSTTVRAMTALHIGYARVSTAEQELTAQINALRALGVEDEQIFVDHGYTGTNRARPGLREALAACRKGDTFVITKLDRLARSLPDARDIVEELTRRQVKLSIGGSIHDPNDPVGRLLFNMLAMVAEFESDLIRARNREGMQIAKAKGRLRGRKPKLSPAQEKLLVDTYRRGQHTTAEIAALFNVARSTVYRTIQRTPVEPEPPETRRIRRFPAPGKDTGTKRKGTTKPGIG